MALLSNCRAIKFLIPFFFTLNLNPSACSKFLLHSFLRFLYFFKIDFVSEIILQTCHYSGLTGIYPGDGKKIPVSGQLGQNSGELPFTRIFLAVFFLTILSNSFFSCKVSICGIEHTQILSISIVTV